MIRSLPLKNLSSTKIYSPNYKCCEWKENNIGLEDFIEEKKLELDIKKAFVGFGERREDRKAFQTKENRITKLYRSGKEKKSGILRTLGDSPDTFSLLL